MQGYYRFDHSTGETRCAQKLLSSVAAAVGTRIVRCEVDGGTYLEAPSCEVDCKRVIQLLASCGLTCTYVSTLPRPLAGCDLARCSYVLREAGVAVRESDGLAGADVLLHTAGDAAQLFAIGRDGQEHMVWKSWIDEAESPLSDQRYCSNYTDDGFWGLHTRHRATVAHTQFNDLPF